MPPGLDTPLRLLYCLERKPNSLRPNKFLRAKAPIQPLYEDGCPCLLRGGLRLVRPHVTIPVPFVLDALGEYLIMTCLRGESLGTVFSKMEPDEVARVRESLSEFARQLRAIPNDAPGVVSGPHHYMPCCDVSRVDEFQFGPFVSVAAFHSYLISRARPQYREEITKAAEGVHAKPHTVYFTHGDLNLRNILVEDGRLTGIVEWTCTGWVLGARESGVCPPAIRSGGIFVQPFFLTTRRNCSSRCRCGMRAHIDTVPIACLTSYYDASVCPNRWTWVLPAADNLSEF